MAAGADPRGQGLRIRIVGVAANYVWQVTRPHATRRAHLWLQLFWRGGKYAARPIAVRPAQHRAPME